MNPDIYEIDLQEGRQTWTVPEYVSDVFDARYIGVTTAQLREMPFDEVAEYRIVRAAEHKAQEELAGRQRSHHHP